MLIPASDLAGTARRALERVAPAGHAAQQADLLMEAELRGIASHGLLRLPRILRRIASGATDAAATGRGTWRGEAFLAVDGERGLGPVVALRALDMLDERVGRTGVAVAAIRNGNHIGMLGYYAERAALRGRSLVVLSTSEALVHPWGGRRP